MRAHATILCFTLYRYREDRRSLKTQNTKPKTPNPKPKAVNPVEPYIPKLKLEGLGDPCGRWRLVLREKVQGSAIESVNFNFRVRVPG